MAKRKRVSLRPSAFRTAKVFAAVLAAYLLQVSVMPLIKVGGVTANLPLAVTAVVTVCFGTLRAFWAGASFGIMTEVMAPARPLLNLALYPLCALLCSVIYSDKNARQLEYERALGKAGRNRNPLLRTVLCGMTNSLLYEAVNVVYIYLRDSVWDAEHIQRALLCVALTTLLTAVVMIPLRHFFGFRRPPREEKGQRLYRPMTEDKTKSFVEADEA